MQTDKIKAMQEEICNILSVVKRPGIESLINFLIGSDFFTAPASTKYHGCYEGGLVEHSWYVWNFLKEKNARLNLGLSEETIAITGILHDICKIEFYGKETKNVKKGTKLNDWGKEVPNWIEEEVVVVNDRFPIGHGEKSVIQIGRQQA